MIFYESSFTENISFPKRPKGYLPSEYLPFGQIHVEHRRCSWIHVEQRSCSARRAQSALGNCLQKNLCFFANSIVLFLSALRARRLHLRCKTKPSLKRNLQVVIQEYCGSGYAGILWEVVIQEYYGKLSYRNTMEVVQYRNNALCDAPLAQAGAIRTYNPDTSQQMRNR